MLLHRLDEKLLVSVATVDLDTFKSVDGNLALEFLGYLKNHAFWVGLQAVRGFAQIYDFDLGAVELGELAETRPKRLELFPFRMHRFGGELYYTGPRFGALVDLKIELK